MGYDIFKFGALYLGAKIQVIPKQSVNGSNIPQYDGKSAISIGPATQKKTITWIKPHGVNLFIADRVLMVNMSWDDLNRNGFINGREIVIVNQRFRCQLLRVGKDMGVPNEWDKAMDIVGEDDSLWHWKNVHFWGADTTIYGTATRALRGFRSARAWCYNRATFQYNTAGFRPALEPLPADDVTPNINLDGIDFCLSSIPEGESFCPILQPIQKDVFADIPVGGKVRMYTLMENGHPIHMDEQARGVTKLTLTDRYFGDEFLVPWVISNGVAVVSQSLPQQGKN